MMKTIGERIKNIREELQLTGEEFGNKFNVAKGTVSNWENNNRTPDAQALIKIADLGDVSLDWLLCRTDIKTAIVVNDKVNGDDIQLEVDKRAYPNGMTHEEVIKILESYKKLQESGFELIPKDDTK
ncbi:MAG: helix-turn-helix transcriptional regulator [Clostridiaceae bacterium]|nr:helix-turn-helix transcriptional regulator [Clostridiaceae bacterium]